MRYNHRFRNKEDRNKAIFLFFNLEFNEINSISLCFLVWLNVFYYYDKLFLNLLYAVFLFL